MKTQSSSDLKCSFPSRKRQHFVTYVTNGLQPCKPMILLGQRIFGPLAAEERE